MALWPEEYEGLRDEARQLAEMIRSTYAGSGSPPKDRDQRVSESRAMLAAMEVGSDKAVDEVVAGVPCRVFLPDAPAQGVYLDIHGGAMIMGSARMNDVTNEGICQRHRVAVVSVDYRLAPEHPFPAGPDDCLAVAAWLVEQAEHRFGADKLVIGGQSAGAYYAALTLVRARDELGVLGRFAGANLLFGVYDLSGTPSNRGVRPTDTPDVLDADPEGFVRSCYLPDRTRDECSDPSISPLYADLTGMPPALFTVGHADHLLDDSLFMAARWQSYGADAELAVYPDCGHGFNGFPMELGKRANERIDAFFERVLA